MGGDRQLDWEGCFNARDLGGLRTAEGRSIRRGAVVRSDALDRLTAAGWAALRAHGIRTVVDLRNDDELGPDAAPRPPEVSTLHLPLDGIAESGFWDLWTGGPQFATPFYYGPHVERFPDRSARVLAAIAGAAPGGVAFHCVGGRDRTGQIAMLLLALLGVEPEQIAADYELSTERLRAGCLARGEPDQGAEVAEYLAAEGTNAREIILSTLASLDVEAQLRAGGLRDQDLAALRARLLEPGAGTPPLT